MQGTVPYLGTFLTDLMMVDTALKDVTKDGLINLEKRRKEFELMTQIQMLQSTAGLYRIVPEPDFFNWFFNCRVYDDAERSDFYLRKLFPLLLSSFLIVIDTCQSVGELDPSRF